uniref:GPI mannosyltransferase 2 n=1 Tax=Oncorhynchus tshawytscha TaxID=74940 RepID=A0A8C8C9A1_ONCTS
QHPLPAECDSTLWTRPCGTAGPASCSSLQFALLSHPCQCLHDGWLLREPVCCTDLRGASFSWREDTPSEPLSIATAARANGLVNVGFLLYLPLQQALYKYWGLRKDNNRYNKCLHYTWIIARLLFTVALGTAVIALPFLVFQYYGYRAFCTPSLSLEQISPALIQLAEDQGYRVPDENAPPPLWCLRPLPLLYSHIQDVYWDVGFLLYFQLKQIPNFLLALPMATLDMVAATLDMYYRDNPARCLRLGLWDRGANKRPDEPTPGFYSPRVFLYVVHATMLLGFGTFRMHVQCTPKTKDLLARVIRSSELQGLWPPSTPKTAPGQALRAIPEFEFKSPAPSFFAWAPPLSCSGSSDGHPPTGCSGFPPTGCFGSANGPPRTECSGRQAPSMDCPPVSSSKRPSLHSNKP